MKKICILIFMMIFITGCTIKCDLRIDTKLRVKEQITITEKNDTLSIYNKDLKKEIFESDYTGGVVEANYNSLNEYKNSGSFSSLFSNLSVSETSNTTSVVISDLNYELFDQEIEQLDLSDIEINIRFHNKISSSNAKSYNEETNTYTWIINKNDPASISFTLDKNSKRWDLIIEDFLNDNMGSLILSGIIILIIIIILIKLYIKSKKNNHI